MLKQTPPNREPAGSTHRLKAVRVFLAVWTLVFVPAKVFSYTRMDTRRLRVSMTLGVVAAIALATLAAGFGVKPEVATAAPANTINFQARLQTASGAIAGDGFYNVRFKLYSASTGGSALWTETYLVSASQGIRSANGYLTANLGGVTGFPSSINWGQQLYLTMEVGGTGSSPSWDGEMSPRLAMTSVPSAFALNSYNSANGFSSSLSILQPTGGNQIFQIPDQQAAGTYNVCIANSASCGFASSSGNGNYIQNQNSSAQTGANFWIAGTGKAAGGLQAPSFDSLAAGNLNIGTTNATSITLGKAGVNTIVAGNLSVGTTSSYGAITLANGAWLTALDSAGTGAINMLSVNSNNEIQVGAALNIDGGIVLPTDGGQMTLSDLPISSSAVAGTAQSYTLRVGSSNVLTVYGEADGAGNAQNLRVAIGSSITPGYTLDVGGDARFTGRVIGANAVNSNEFATLSQVTGGSGNGNYIQNQNSSAQSGANFWISGTGKSAGGLLAPTIDALTAGALGIGGTTATSITIGKVGVTTTVAGNLTVNGTASFGSTVQVTGDLQAGNQWTRSVTRAIPTVVGDAVDIGTFNVANGARMLDVSIVVPSGGFATTKRYMIPTQYNATANVWQVVQPITDAGVYASNDFALDINGNNAAASLRIRRVSGTTAGTAYVTVQQQGNAAETFTASTATTSVTTPTVIFGGTALTQTGGKVGIGTLAPGHSLDVQGGNINTSGGLYTGGVLRVSSTGAGTLTTLSLSGVLTSTVATGTAPLTVASTTKVTNLNADLLDGLDSSAFCQGSCVAGGSAAGDLTGTYPNPTIAKLQGSTLTLNTPASGNILQFNGTAWVNQAVTGDISISSTGVAAIAAGSIVNADLASGSFTNITAVGTLTSLTTSGAATIGGNLTVNGTDIILSDGSKIRGAAGGTQILTSGNGAQPLKVGGLVVSSSYSNTAPTNGVYIEGSVGIGATAPASKLDVAGSISTSQNNVRTYHNVYSWGTSTSSITGTLEIVLPNTWNNTMAKFTISGYDYSANAAWTAVVSGYNYLPSTQWINTSAEIRGAPAPFSSIRLAYDSVAGKNVLLLGTTSTVWSIPQFSITEVVAGFSGRDAWGSGYSSSFLTSEANITNINSPTTQVAAYGQVFLQGGNSFATNAILGTNDNFALTFETNNVGRLSIDTSGNVNLLTGGLQVGATTVLTSGRVLQNVTYNGGTVGVGYGGTGVTSFTQYGILFGNNTGNLGVTGQGTNGQCLVATTGGAPAWGTCAGAGSGVTLQAAYNNSLGGTTPEIVLDSSKTTLDVQAYSGQTADLFNLRAYAASGLGVSRFSVTADGAVTSAGSMTVSSGGASINGGINNNTGGITNTGNITGVTGITTTGGYTQSGATANLLTGATTINNTLTVSGSGTFSGNLITNGQSLQGTIVDASPTNFLANGSFETSTTGWTGNASTLLRSTAEARFGNASLEMTYAGTGDGYAVYNLPTMPKTIEGRSFTYSFWAKATVAGNTTSAPFLQPMSPSGSVCSMGVIAVTTSWKRYQTTCTVTGNASTTWRAVLRPVNNASSTTYFDGITVQSGTSGTDYTPYATTEVGATIMDGLTVSGAGNTAVDMVVTGRIRVGADAAGVGGVYVDNTNNKFVGANGANIGLFNGSWILNVSTTGAAVTGTLSVSGASTLNSLTVTNGASVGGALTVTAGVSIGSGLEVTGYGTANAGATNAGQYTKLGSCTITTQYYNCRSIINIVEIGDGNAFASRGTVDFRAKQQNALGGAPTVNVEVTDVAGSITADDFVAVTTTNDATTTVVELYGKLDALYQGWRYTPILNSGLVRVAWLNGSQPFVVSLPAGTQTVGSYYNVLGSTLAVAGTLTNSLNAIATFNTTGTKPVLIGNGSNFGLMIGYGGSDIQGRSGTNFATNSNLYLNQYGGNVGIGSGTANHKLDVQGGNVNTSGSYKINGTDVCTSTGCTPAAGSSSYIQNGTTPQSANFNVTGNGTVGGSLTVGGSTIQLSNFYPEYRWRWANSSTDSNWKKIADISLSNAMYTAASFQIDVTETSCNFGCSANVLPMRFYASAYRSGAVVDTPDTGTVAGPSTDYVRLVRTALGAYELQVRAAITHRTVDYTVRQLSALGASTVTYASGTPTDGSTTGTVYTSSVTGYTQKLPNAEVGGTLLVQGSATFNSTVGFTTSLSGNGKIALQTNDGWLRLNPTAAFTSGIYSASGVFRTDGTLQVGSSGSTLSVVTGGSLAYNTNTLFANTTGNVGIGTASPGHKLDVQSGNINTSGSYKINGVDICTSSGCAVAPGSTNYIQNGTSPQNANFNITGNGTIGGTLAVGTVGAQASWVARSITASSWRSVTYGDDKFVAVAYASGANQVATSPDGVTWTPRTATNDTWTSVTYGNGKFVAVGDDNSDKVMTSSDGITWAAGTGVTGSWNSVAYGNGIFVAVGGTGSFVMTSTNNGASWTARTPAQNNSWTSVTYGNGQFVAVATSGTNRVMTSPDGITWTAQTAAAVSSWRSVTYGGGQFVAVATAGTNRVMTSPDGITWTAQNAAEANSWYSVTYGGGQYMAVSSDGTNRVMLSSDGVTWSSQAASASNSWQSVVYGNATFVAVSSDGTNRVMTRALSPTVFQANGSSELNGNMTVKIQSTAALQIQDGAGYTLLTADTLTKGIGIGTVAPQTLLHVGVTPNAATYPATEVAGEYYCAEGDVLTGTTCTNTETYAATYNSGTYSCPSGGTLSGTTCTYVYNASYYSGGYYCPSGGSLSGTTCTTSYSATYTAPYYSCPNGGSLSGSTCTQAATPNYYCPGGGSLSGTTCYKNYPGLTTQASCEAAGHNWSGGQWGVCTDSFAAQVQSYSCPGGWSVSGSNCTQSAQYNAGGYSCPSGGSLSGTNCVSSYGASYQSPYYWCPSGGSLSGTTCTYTYTATNTGAGYVCPDGGVLSGTTCYVYTTYAASPGSLYFVCAAPSTLSGEECIAPMVSALFEGRVSIGVDSNIPLQYTRPATLGGNPSFRPYAAYATASSPMDIALADFDGDGDLDQVVVNNGSNSISVLLNKLVASGKFQGKVDYTTASTPYGVTTADIDNDDDIDIIVANSSSASISVFKNNGSGAFAAKVDYTTASAPRSLEAADIDGDNDLDIVTANYTGDNVSVLKNNGDGTFATKVDYAATNGTTRVALADFDSDGDIDIAAANYLNDVISILKNNGGGAGTFATKIDYASNDAPNDMIGVDVDGDGDTDLVTANTGSGDISVLKNNGDATFATKADYAAVSSAAGLAALDVEGDGDLDLAVVASSSSYGYVSIMRNNGTGAYGLFSTTFAMQSSGYAYAVTAGDVNGDDIPDVIVAAYNGNAVNVFINDTSQPVTATTYAATTGISAIDDNSVGLVLQGAGNQRAPIFVAQDADGNPWVAMNGAASGNSLLAVGKNAANSSLNYSKAATGAGSISLAAQVAYTTQSNPYDVVAGDLDNDGDNDMVVVNSSSNTMSVLKNNSNGTFAAKADYSTASTPTSLVIVNVDGDSDKDVVTTNNASNSVSVLKNNGDGTFASKVDYTTISSPREVAAADFDGDGDIDLAVAGTASTSTSVLLNNGNGTYATKVDYAASGSSYNMSGVTVADFDGDGDIDIVSSSYMNIYLFKNNGNGTFAASVGTNAGSGGGYIYRPTSVDIDGDGDKDILAVNPGNNYLTIISNNGAGIFTGTSTTVNSAPYSLDVGDIDGDDDLDVVIGHEYSSYVSVYTNNGGVFSNNNNPNTSYYMYGIAMVDVNGDGKLDILAPNSASSSVSVILNQTSFPTPKITYVATLGVSTSSASAAGLIIQGSANQTGHLFVLQDSTGANLLTVDATGKLQAKGTITGGVASPDYAENIGVSDPSIEAADVVAMDPNRNEWAIKATAPYDSNVLGVISTSPGFLTNASSVDEASAADQRPLALSGRVPVKVSNMNGVIRQGDYLTSSVIPGVAMKATGPGAVIGVAMADFTGTESSSYICGGYTCGKVLMFINPSATNPAGQEMVMQGSSAVLSTLTVNGALHADSINTGGLLSSHSLKVTGNAEIGGYLKIGGDLTVAGTAQVGKLVVKKHILSDSEAPLVAKGSAAGQDGLVTIDGTDVAGTLNITVKARPQQGDTPAEILNMGSLADVTFFRPYDFTPRIVVSPTNPASVKAPVYLVKTATGWQLMLSEAAVDGTVYQFDYVIVGSKGQPTTSP